MTGSSNVFLPGREDEASGDKLNEKSGAGSVFIQVDRADDNDGHNKKDGVHQVEAVTQVWSKTTMWTVFALLYLVSLADAILHVVHGSLVSYVTSSFSKHGLVALTGIFASVMGGVCKPGIAKLIDIRGRCEGFLLMIFLVVVGMLTKAGCKDVATYAIGHTFYYVGHTGLSYMISIILSDMTSLHNRMFMWGIYMSPQIASALGGPKVAELFQERSNFRWAFISFCIILAGLSTPVAFIFIYHERKAKRLSLLKERTGRPFWEATKFYFVEFDVIGMVLTIVSFSLVLVPINIANQAPQGWKTNYVIGMLVGGILGLAILFVWEKWFATVQYVPFRHLKNRTIIGACFLAGFLSISIFTWDTYYYPYLQVVHNLSISVAGYALYTYVLAQVISAPFIGLLLKYSGRYYWVGVAGIPFCVLGTALLYHFCQPGDTLLSLVIVQCLNGIAGAIWGLTGPLAIMAAVEHQDIAVVLALQGMFSSIGRAIGLGIAGGIWTNHLPRELTNALPANAKNQSSTLYGDMTKQLAQPVGTPVRDAVITAYGIVQRKMVIAGCTMLPFIAVCVLIWRNRPLDKKQSVGNVF